MISLLEWDTDFFSLTIGAINTASLRDLDMEEFEAFDLVYVFAKEKELELPNMFFFADEKLTYQKPIKHPPVPIDQHIHSVLPATEIRANLIALAFQAGNYSRFRIDTRFPAGAFEKLYREWLTNSVNRLFAKEVYVLKSSGSSYEGLITLDVKKGIPDIGLIAVDENIRGTGIGTKLLSAAENWAFHEQHANEIQVVTQGFNKQACSFYEKNGFTIASRQYVYHWWSPKYKR